MSEPGGREDISFCFFRNSRTEVSRNDFITGFGIKVSAAAPDSFLRLGGPWGVSSPLLRTLNVRRSHLFN